MKLVDGFLTNFRFYFLSVSEKKRSNYHIKDLERYVSFAKYINKQFGICHF